MKTKIVKSIALASILGLAAISSAQAQSTHAVAGYHNVCYNYAGGPVHCKPRYNQYGNPYYYHGYPGGPKYYHSYNPYYHPYPYNNYYSHYHTTHTCPPGMVCK